VERYAIGDKRHARRAAAPQLHPIVAVDVVIFTIDAGRLQTLLVQVRAGPCAGAWAFPGGLVGMEESLEDAARRELSAQTGLRGVYLEQLRSFGDPGRDPQARVISTAYFALVPAKEMVQGSAKYADVGWFPVRRLPRLAYDHDAIARTALERLRAKLAYTNIVYGLLAVEFTLGELQGIYEILLDRRLDRRNFRKKILASGLLRALRKQRRGAHRPAALYRFAQRRPMVVQML
jgi:ADP-ribose pyrophosphatase YjhB (NUDIX family)